MITDIPTASEFQNAGINLLNLAWDSTISLLQERIVDLDRIEIKSSANEKYWESVQPVLSSSLTLVHQAVEFFLKGKIAEINPYLLIAKRSSRLTEKSQNKKTSFSDCRTIDAQDLIRVHDAANANHLSNDFYQWYEKLRRLRNKLIHTVDKKIAITDKDVLIKIMESCEYCIGPRSWMKVRKKYLLSTPSRHLIRNDQIDENVIAAFDLEQMQSEIMTVIEYLEPQYSKLFFGFRKKQRRYICLRCLSVRERNDFFDFKNLEEVWLNTAQFSDPLSSQPTTVHCIFCDGNYLIKREKCPICGNHVIDAYNRLCLSCTEYIPKSIDIQPSFR